MRLKPGDRAPLFARTDIRGERIDLEALCLGGQPVWLGFFRFASCPLCNLRVHQMISEWPRFEKRCRFVAVFQSPADRFESFITRHSPPFPVIADPERELFVAYRLEDSILAVMKPRVIAKTIAAKRAGFDINPFSPKDGAALRVPADFVVAPNGLLSFVFYGSNVADSASFDAIDKAL